MFIALTLLFLASCGPAEHARDTATLERPMSAWEKGVADCEAQPEPYASTCLQLFIAQYQTKYGLY